MKKLGIVGLGYVGLPLAVEFGQHRPVIGYDINVQRISELARQNDRNLECSGDSLARATSLSLTADIEALRPCEIFIITVPTPVGKANQPDLRPITEATKAVGAILKPLDIVIYESTVYPGAVEEVCVPLLEEASGLTYNQDFFCGYSPERINPGDKIHRLTDIVKITSGSTPEVADEVDALYAEIVRAGTHKASSIRVAEAAKVIENTQRDVNIALVNELSLIFNKLNIETSEVLAAAATKWNFLPFRPGLVGGHCIGVDPYYLTFKAQEVGYHPEVILAGRRINDRMGFHVAEQVILLLHGRGVPVLGSNTLILGFSFKENCPDFRNTRVIDIINAMTQHGSCVDVYDPWVDINLVSEEYGIQCLEDLSAARSYDAVIIAVGHSLFADLGIGELRALGKPISVIYDVKGIFSTTATDGRL